MQHIFTHSFTELLFLQIIPTFFDYLLQMNYFIVQYTQVSLVLSESKTITKYEHSRSF